MPIISVKCPYCGKEFVVKVPRERKKGMGAHYGQEIKKLTPLHEEILLVLYERRAIYGGRRRGLPKCTIGAILADRGRRVSGNSLSGRLSELAGAGYVMCERGEVRIFDIKSRQYRYVKKPLWYLTERGKRYVEERLLGEEL